MTNIFVLCTLGDHSFCVIPFGMPSDTVDRRLLFFFPSFIFIYLFGAYRVLTSLPDFPLKEFHQNDIYWSKHAAVVSLHCVVTIFFLVWALHCLGDHGKWTSYIEQTTNGDFIFIAGVFGWFFAMPGEYDHHDMHLNYIEQSNNCLNSPIS